MPAGICELRLFKKGWGFHVDNIDAGERSATWLANSCVRPDSEGVGVTTIASSHEAIALLGNESRKALRKYPVRIISSGLPNGKITPIIGGSEEFPYLTYGYDGVEFIDPDNDKLRNAFLELDEVLSAATRFILLRSGDMILMRNAFTPLNLVHGRSVFSACWNENYVTSRYMLKTYAHCDFTKLLDFVYPNTHTLRPVDICNLMQHGDM